MTTQGMIGQYVLVRTRSAGVHMGTLEAFAGLNVLLTDARRLWKWTEANSLHEVSLHGCGQDSLISEPVARIVLTEAIEVLFPTPKARRSLEAGRWTR